MVAIMALNASYSLHSAVFPSMPTSHQHKPLVQDITTNIHVNRMAR